MKILSWNLMFNHPQPLKDRINTFKSFIPKDVSVMCFQEVLKSDVELISTSFPNYNVFPRKGKYDYGQIILVKKNIQVISSEIIPLPTTQNRVANKITISTSGKTLDVITLHLESMPYNASLRMQQMILISRYIDKPTVICGDVNMNSKEISFFKGLVDMDPNGPATYFGGRFGKINSKKRYDRVYSNFSIAGLEYIGAVLNPNDLEYPGTNVREKSSFLSDHDGMIIEI